MKTIQVFFFVYIFCCFNSLFAQEELGNGFLFPQFEKGEVVFKNGVRNSALLNYSLLQQEMLFLDKDSTMMALAETNNVLVVIFGERRFFPISSKGIFYEEIQTGNGYLFVQYKATDKSICHGGTPNGIRTIITIGEVNGIMDVQNAKGPSGF